MAKRKSRNPDHVWRKNVPGPDREDLLGCQAVKVSQQALSQRFLSFPAVLFEGVLKELLPHLH